MNEAQRWWNDTNAELNDDPVFIAEGIALDVALQVGDRLRAEKLTRKTLAERLGTSGAYVTQILGGHTNMTLLTLCKLARALDLALTVRMQPSKSNWVEAMNLDSPSLNSTNQESFMSSNPPFVADGNTPEECAASIASPCPEPDVAA